MDQPLIDTQTRAGAFDTVAQADGAIRALVAAGFSKDQLAVICPAKFTNQFHAEALQANAPTAEPGSAIAMGGAMGAALGGLALAATVATGGAAGMLAAGVLIGGGAIAGGFGNLVVSKGYEHETDDSYKQAIEQGQIVVAVEAHGEDGSRLLAQAQRILDGAGAKALSSRAVHGIA